MIINNGKKILVTSWCGNVKRTLNVNMDQIMIM